MAENASCSGNVIHNAYLEGAKRKSSAQSFTERRQVNMTLELGEIARKGNGAALAVESGMTLFVNRRSLGVVVGIGEGEEAERKALRRGRMGYSLYVEAAIPFLILEAERGENVFRYRSLLSRYNYKKALVDIFLQGPGGESPYVEMLIAGIKTSTSRVVLLRTESLLRQHLKRMREALAEQEARYQGQADLEEAWKDVAGRRGAQEMKRLAGMIETGHQRELPGH